MKSEFKSFGTPDNASIESAWRSAETIFIFDTNVLLNLYGYEESTRADFFKILEKIKDRVWIPHQVGLEYHRRRLDVIKNEKKTFREISSELDGISGNIQQKLNALALSKKFPELNVHLKNLIDSIQEQVSKCGEKIKEWDARQADVRSNDEILDKIDVVTGGRIGPRPLSQEWLDKIFKEGEVRYDKKIPPGFRDKPKAKGEVEIANFTYDGLNYERQYGDLIIWKQIINMLIGGDVKNVFFVTDDTKDDWWQMVDSGGMKYIGPNEHLKSEIYRETSIDLFHMYTSSDFLVDSNRVLHADIQSSSIEDIKDKNQAVFDLNDFFIVSDKRRDLVDALKDETTEPWESAWLTDSAKEAFNEGFLNSQRNRAKWSIKNYSELDGREDSSKEESPLKSLNAFDEEVLYRIINSRPDLKSSKFLMKYLGLQESRRGDETERSIKATDRAPGMYEVPKGFDLNRLMDHLTDEDVKHLIDRGFWMHHKNNGDD